jgi:hypothetical protein
MTAPPYRDDKRGTTLQLLPGLLGGQRGAHLTAQAAGTRIDGPQALLVSNDPYGMGDIAGLGRRPRLDVGTLGVVAIRVDSARQTAGLIRRGHGTGLTTLTAEEVTVNADAPQIPVGIDGETVMLPAPVRCAIRPRALRVVVPRQRPGSPLPSLPCNGRSCGNSRPSAPRQTASPPPPSQTSSEARKHGRRWRTGRRGPCAARQWISAWRARSGRLVPVGRPEASSQLASWLFGDQPAFGQAAVGMPGVVAVGRAYPPGGETPGQHRARRAGQLGVWEDPGWARKDQLGAC